MFGLRQLEVNQQLLRFKTTQLVEGLVPGVGARAERGEGLAGGNITDRAADPLLGEKERGIIVVGVLHQHGALHDGGGRNDADHVPVDKALCQRRVLHLLTDGDLVAVCDQAGDVALGGMEGNAAHRRALVLRLAAVAGRQREVELFGRDQGVLVEHLIEVAQAKEEQTVRVLLMDFQILLPHRGQFSHENTSYCGCRDRHCLSPQRDRNVVRWRTESAPLPKRGSGLTGGQRRGCPTDGRPARRPATRWSRR